MFSHKDKKRINQQIHIVSASKYFDAKWYLDHNPDVRECNKNPAEHYLKHGWLEGRDPSAKFSTKTYLEKYPECKVCPLIFDHNRNDFMDLSICAIMKNEGPYVKEWIDYHRLVGVKRFYIYDNESADNMKNVLNPYIEQGIVVYKYYPGDKRQMVAYEECCKEYQNKTFWLALIDGDEFMMPTHDKDLPTFLQNYTDFPCVYVNMIYYDSNGHLKKPKGNILENYTRVEYDLEKHNRQLKSIVQPKFVTAVPSCHFCDYKDNRSGVTENFQEIHADINNSCARQASDFVSINKIRINHYFTKSEAEYRAKIERGRATQRRGVKYTFNNEKCNFKDYKYDYCAYKYLIKLNPHLILPEGLHYLWLAILNTKIKLCHLGAKKTLPKISSAQHVMKKTTGDYDLIASSKLFNKRWYLKSYPDVAKAKCDPIKHYMNYGWKEGRNPSSKFNTRLYLTLYPDIKSKQINPLLHYIKHGRKEGRTINQQTSFWKRLFSHKNKDYALIKHSKLFNARWYLKNYPDVAKVHADPIMHYLTIGWKEGRNPGPNFDGNEYLNINEDIKKAGINPLLHYLKDGKKENRLTRVHEPVLPSLKTEHYFHRVYDLRQKKIENILLVSHELTYTGAPLSLLKTAQVLTEMGYHIKTISLKKGPLEKEFKKYGPVYTTTDIDKIVRIAAHCDFAIINTIVNYAEYVALNSLLPTVWWIREPHQTLDMYRYKYIKPILQEAKNLYTMSNLSREEFLPYNSNIGVIKHGLDDEYRDAAINPKKLVFAVIGSIDKRKGQDIFAEAIRLLPTTKRNKAQFYIVGDYQNKDFLNSLTVGIENSLKILSPITNHKDLLGFYESLSCVVIPSREEPTSRVAIEAMMMARPVLMSDHVGAQYLMNRKNGAVFANEDAKALSELMAKIIDHPEKLKAMSIAARQSYIKNNSIDVYKKNLKKMLRDTEFTKVSSQKLLVHLHMYYQEQLPYFLTKLKNITCPYDLYFTCHEPTEETINGLKQLKPDVHILPVPDVGYDVWPFIQVLKQVDLSQYNYVLKLHTKNYRENKWIYKNIIYQGFKWRNDLIEPLVGKKSYFNRNLAIFRKHPNVGMLGSQNLIGVDNKPIHTRFNQILCNKLHMKYQSCPFVAGTMFMVRAKLLARIQQASFSEDEFDSEMITGTVSSLAHSMERMIAVLCQTQGYSLLGVDSLETYISRYCSRFNKRKKYKKEVQYIEHSPYFNSRWYLKKYPEVRHSKLSPAEHYLLEGWQMGYNPGPKFKNEEYFQANPDVRTANINPLFHYERSGRWENRSIKTSVKNSSYYEQLPYYKYTDELKAWYKGATKKKLNLNNPKTFNEKIQWLKLYDSTPLKTQLADTYLVRDWVKEKIGEQYLIPLLGVYDSFEEINFNKLPNQFVIKCNHGSGWNIAVKDKSSLDLADIKEKIDAWMNSNFAFNTGFELYYKDIKPKIIIEKYMEEIESTLYDYRFFCCNGRVEQIWLDTYSDTHNHKRKIYDRDWHELNIIVKWPKLEDNVPAPKNLQKMVSLAEKISGDFSFVCLNFHNVNSKIYFGKITFTSMDDISQFKPRIEDLKLGQKIKLPKLAYDLDRKIYCKPEECYQQKTINLDQITHKKAQPETKKLKLSIIIPIYNALPDVKQCLKSLLDVKLDKSTEVIMVDDCSQPDTKNYLQSFAKRHKNFHYHRNKQNSGFIKTSNKGMSFAKNDVMVILNSDTKVPYLFDKRVLDCFKSDKNIAVASPLSTHSGLFMIPEDAQYDLNALQKKITETVRPTYPLITPEGFCLCLRKDIIDKIGKLDEIYGMGYCEEDDLILRALTLGYKTVLINNLIVYHKRHASFSSERRRLILEKNLKTFKRRWDNLQPEIRKQMHMMDIVKKCNEIIEKLVDKKGDASNGNR